MYIEIDKFVLYMNLLNKNIKLSIRFNTIMTKCAKGDDRF